MRTGDRWGSSTEPRGTRGEGGRRAAGRGGWGRAGADSPASPVMSGPRKGVRISVNDTSDSDRGSINNALPAEKEPAPPQTLEPDAGRPPGKGCGLREVWP